MEPLETIEAVLCTSALVSIACVIIHKFMATPSAEQIDNVRQWLVGAVTNAEKDLGSGTGALKLRQVYDVFLVRFPKIAQIISFEKFSKLVDEALDIMREMMKNNPTVKAYVEGEAKQS